MTTQTDGRSPAKNRRILIVDDNEAIHEDLRKLLSPSDDGAESSLAALEARLFGGGAAGTPGRDRYELSSAHQGRDGAEMVHRAAAEGRPFAVAFVDMRMPPGWDGLETIEHLWRHDPDLQVVICTAYSDHSWQDIVNRLGTSHQLLILKKPFDNAEVCQLAAALTEKWWQTRLAGLKRAELERTVEERTAELRRSNDDLLASVRALEASEQALRRSEERYELSARGTNGGLFDWDLLHNRVYYSPRWRQMLGLDDPDTGSEAGPEEWLSRIHMHDGHAFRTRLDAHLRGETPHLEHEHRLRRSDGTYLWVACRGLAVRTDDGRPFRMAGSITDVTSRKEAEEELRRGAFYDRLTGLPNRALLKESLQRAISEPGRGTFAVLYLDLDRFKIVNDSLGHRAGDQLLINVAERLTTCVAANALDRGGGRKHIVARLGGDEFVVLLEGIEGPDEAARVVARIQESFAAPFCVAGSHDVHCTASIGIAMAREGYTGADGVDAALRDADTAMYHAKEKGKARHALFDATMHERAVSRLRLEADLRRALEGVGGRDCELLLFYQPIIDLDTGRVAGLEALCRWRHPERGLIGPGEFVPVAEESGLIVPLGNWVLGEACRQVKAWERAGAAVDGLTLSVNLSARQFVLAGLVEEVTRTLRTAGMDPRRLNLEITESAVMDDLDTSIIVLQRLRKLGVSVAMDDFGTGYSSLSCLKRLPINSLKIDRSFVGQMGFVRENSAIIHAIVTLARNLKMKVVAEGVETQDQLATFLTLDCDMVQGFYFSPPMTAEQVPAWLDARAARRMAA